MMVPVDAPIEAFDPAGRYVSRAALKLIAGLDHFGYRPDGLHVLDVGASTGVSPRFSSSAGLPASTPSMLATTSFTSASATIPRYATGKGSTPGT